MPNYTKKHGKHGTTVYWAYRSMLQRCLNPKNPSYHKYGGRNIKVCRRWLKSFANFYEDMGDPPKGLSLDRINNDKGYSPKNCRWATLKQQSLNTRRNHLVTHNGKTLTIKEWSDIMGFPRELLRKRLSRGWSAERAIETPVLTGGKRE